MANRSFIGSKPGGGKTSEAARLKRLEIEKGGKLPLSSTERYKRIMKKKLQENMAESAGSGMPIQMPGAKPVERKVSKQTQDAMRMIAQRKAMKEEKELRNMVVVQARNLSGAGRIAKDGKIYDQGNNIAMKIDAKTGKITTNGGMYVGKYNTRKMMRTNMLIKDKLQTVSPYAIQQKKIQMLEQMEQQKLIDSQGNVHGTSASEQFIEKHFSESGGGVYGDNSQSAHNRGSNVGAWGAMSNNVLGTYTDNIWGGMADNVWGGTDSNIWGGIGGSAWGTGGAGVFGGSTSAWGRGGPGVFGKGVVNWNKRGLRIFGSGGPNQKNYLKKPLGVLFAGVPGLRRLFSAKARSK